MLDAGYYYTRVMIVVCMSVCWSHGYELSKTAELTEMSIVTKQVRVLPHEAHMQRMVSARLSVCLSVCHTSA